jgi:hypothetical protein
MHFVSLFLLNFCVISSVLALDISPNSNVVFKGEPWLFAKNRDFVTKTMALFSRRLALSKDHQKTKRPFAGV